MLELFYTSALCKPELIFLKSFNKIAIYLQKLLPIVKNMLAFVIKTFWEAWPIWPRGGSMGAIPS